VEGDPKKQDRRSPTLVEQLMVVAATPELTRQILLYVLGSSLIRIPDYIHNFSLFAFLVSK